MTNVFCDFCEGGVCGTDSFVVETPEMVRAYHFFCGQQIADALAVATTPGETNQGAEAEVSLTWQIRALEDRLAVTEELTRKTAAVWKLWLTEAGKGSINPGTFDAMRTLMGIDS